MFDSVTLQSAQIIAITQLFEEILEDLPIAVPTGCAELAFEMLSEILLNMVVVEQRIVHVDEKDHRHDFAHAVAPPASPTMFNLASPQTKASTTPTIF